MRDPEGKLSFQEHEVKRDLYAPLDSDHFLRSNLAKNLENNGSLIPFQFADSKTIVSPRVPFVSYPYEWCDAQFWDAGSLTIDVSQKILKDGFELKDASAWNIIFENCKPIFCDHLSFQRINMPQWWSFAQFLRHFVFPLLVSKYSGLSSSDSFKQSRDGLDSKVASGFLGVRKWVTRYWPVLLNTTEKGAGHSHKSNSKARRFHNEIYLLTRWFLKGVKVKTYKKRSIWINYTTSREHYSENASKCKSQTLDAWLGKCRALWVVDLGCNTGEFTKLALSHGSQVISVDLDHESIQNLYITCKGMAVYPVLANLDDLAGGRGWGGKEFPGLIDRLTKKADVLLMLALVHHLAISSSIPIKEIASLARLITKKYLVVELLSEQDPLVVNLAQQRNRNPDEFSLAGQEEAFAEFFTLIESYWIPDTKRKLMLYQLASNSSDIDQLC